MEEVLTSPCVLAEQSDVDIPLFMLLGSAVMRAFKRGVLQQTQTDGTDSPKVGSGRLHS